MCLEDLQSHSAPIRSLPKVNPQVHPINLFFFFFFLIIENFGGYELSNRVTTCKACLNHGHPQINRQPQAHNPRKISPMAASALHNLPYLALPPLSCRRRPRATFSVRATSGSSSPNTPEGTTSVRAKDEGGAGAGGGGSLSFSPPPNFKPPEPKTFGVRPDKGGDIFGASLALFFRFGTGVFANGYAKFSFFFNLHKALQTHCNLIFKLHFSVHISKKHFFFG